MGEISRIARSLAEIRGLIGWAQQNATKGVAGGPVEMILTRPNEDRTADQNDKFHPMVRDIKKHLGQKFPMLKTEKHWRDWLVAQFEDQITAPSLDFQQIVIVNTKSTSELGKKGGSEFIEWLYAVGSQEGVVWSEPALKVYEQYGETA